MLNDDQLDRFARHIVLREIGGYGQMKLLNSHILVIGAGGLGVPVLSYLAAAGIGTISFFDHDTVALSNLQRQILYREKDIGRPKAKATEQFLRQINSAMTIHAFQERFGTKHQDRAEKADVIVDCSDTFQTRLMINDMAVKARTPLVSAAITGFEGQLAVFDPSKGPDLPCYRCFLPSEPPIDQQKTCADSGVLGTAAGIMGTLQAQEVIKTVLNIGTSLRGKIMLVDSLDMRQRVIDLPRDPACMTCCGLDR